MRRNVVLSAYNRTKYLDQTQAIMQLKRIVKFHLRALFITRQICVGASACDRTPLLKGPDACSKYLSKSKY